MKSDNELNMGNEMNFKAPAIATALVCVLALASCGSDTARSAEAETDVQAADEIIVVDETPDTDPTDTDADTDLTDTNSTSDSANTTVTNTTDTDTNTTDTNANLAISQATFFGVVNEIVLPNGDRAPVTWEVCCTENDFWDGASRPDNPPPQGLQGLKQGGDASSGPYRVRLEVNTGGGHKGSSPGFELTPVIYGTGGWRAKLQTLKLWYYFKEDTWNVKNPGSGGVEMCGKDPMIFGFANPQGGADVKYQVSVSCTSDSTWVRLSTPAN
jgi:hypothetical protein